MTTREKAQLERLLQKKEQEEAAEKEFFTKVKCQRKKVIHVLKLEESEAAYIALQAKATESGVTVSELLTALQKVPDDWISRQAQKQKLMMKSGN